MCTHSRGILANNMVITHEIIRKYNFTLFTRSFLYIPSFLIMLDKCLDFACIVIKYYKIAFLRNIFPLCFTESIFSMLKYADYNKSNINVRILMLSININIDENNQTEKSYIRCPRGPPYFCITGDLLRTLLKRLNTILMCRGVPGGPSIGTLLSVSRTAIRMIAVVFPVWI